MNLLDKLKDQNKKYISIPEFIRSNAKTRAIAPLRKEFEKLIQTSDKVTFERTSEIFITKGLKKGEKNLKYFPLINDNYISHIIIRN